jgi:hypothetical protein
MLFVALTLFSARQEMSHIEKNFCRLFLELCFSKEPLHLHGCIMYTHSQVYSTGTVERRLFITICGELPQQRLWVEKRRE